MAKMLPGEADSVSECRCLSGRAKRRSVPTYWILRYIKKNYLYLLEAEVDDAQIGFPL